MALTYIQGQWETSPGLFAQITSEEQLYKYLPKIGFDSYQELVHHAGEAKLYANSSEMYPFQFLCLLKIGGYCYPVLIKDVQSVLQFTKEIDAHRKGREDVVAAALADLTKTLKDTSQLIKSLSRLTSSHTVAKQDTAKPDMTGVPQTHGTLGETQSSHQSAFGDLTQSYEPEHNSPIESANTIRFNPPSLEDENDELLPTSSFPSQDYEQARSPFQAAQEGASAPVRGRASARPDWRRKSKNTDLPTIADLPTEVFVVDKIEDLSNENDFSPPPFSLSTVRAREAAELDALPEQRASFALKQGNGAELLGSADPRSDSIGIIDVAPNTDRESVVAAILTQDKLRRKQIVVNLPAKNKAFHRPSDFDGLKNIRRRLQAQLIIVAPIGSAPAEFARQHRFPVYSSKEIFARSLGPVTPQSGQQPRHN